MAITSPPAQAASEHDKKPAPTADTKAAPPLSTAVLVNLVESAHVLAPEYPVHISLDKNEALIVTVRHPNATDQDCKIDAVLLAKAIMDVYPKQIIRVKLILSDPKSAVLHEIAVTTGDVKAYAVGTITKDDLLSSLEIDRVNSLNENVAPIDIQPSSGAPPVVPGVFVHERQLLAGRIANLKDHGTGTKPFEEMMAKIEVDVQKPTSERPIQTIQEELRELNGRLNDQEQAIRQAQDVAAGKTKNAFGGQGGNGNGGGRRFGGGGGGGANRLKRMQAIQEKLQNSGFIPNQNPNQNPGQARGF